MNNIELYVKGSSDTNYTRLDLFKDETISLTQTIQDVKDPAKIFTNFSKSFSLPASKTNNKFFKHYHNFIQSQDYSYDARKKSIAKIELNSLPFEKGKLRLEGVDLKNGRPDTYRVTFFGELDLKEVLGDKKLQDLDFLDQFDRLYTSTAVQSALESSTGTDVTGSDGETYSIPTLVSLISNSMRGFYSTSTTPKYYESTTDEINKQGGNLNTSNGPLSGYYWKDLVYSIRLYVIIKAIENSSATKDNNNNKQIVFSNDFFNTTNTSFYNLYMLCQRNAGKLLEGLGSSYTPNKQSGKAYDNAINNHTNNLLLQQSDWDIYGLTSTQQFQFAITVNFTSITGFVYVDLRDTSSNTVVTTFTYTAGGQRSFAIGNGEYELRFRAENSGVVVQDFSFQLIGLNQITSITTGNVDAGFTIPSEAFIIRNNIPDIKIIDFLTGLFKMFNLTAYRKDGKIYVDTLDSYYNSGTLRDITDLTDSTSKTVDKALPYREIAFKYEDTDNILAKQYKEQFQREWGSAAYNDDGSLDSNNTTYEIVLPFQHMMFEKLTTGLQVGHLLDDKQDPYLGKPLIYYPIHSTATGETATAINLITEINGYDSGTSPNEESVTAYWIPSNTPAIISTGAGYPESIHFNLEISEWNQSSDYTDTLFEKYYKSYITNVFRFNERITKIKSKLPISFLQQYTLADELQIGDLTYRINSITTNLQTGESSLELLNGKEAVVSSGVGYVSIQISSSNSSTASTACGYSLNTTVYYTGLLGNTTQLFTNEGLTTSYTGSGNFHAFPGSNYATIDTNGYVSNYQPCPTQAPTMTTSTASNITYQSFTANGSLDVANGTVIEKGFYIGTDPTYTNNTPKVVVSGTSTGSYSYNKTSGVSGNTIYYVTAYAVNGNGEGVGTTVSFTTPSTPVPPTVNALTEQNVSYTGFTARLEITSDGGDTINGAGFYMGTNNVAATNNPHYNITPAPTSTGIKTYDFGNSEGILANTTYYYWATATNQYSSTKGVSSSYETVVTNAAPSAPSVQTQTESSVTSTSFTGNINITNDNGASITSAGIWMGTNSSAYNAAGNTFYSISTTSTGVKSLNFTSLTGDTNYYYWGSATNSAGTTISSSYETVTTPVQTYPYVVYYNNTSAYYACVVSSTSTYYSTSSSWAAGITLYTDSGATTLAPNGWYRYNPNTYNEISGGNGLLGAQQNCNLDVQRLRITTAYPSTNFYDITTAFNSTLSTTKFLWTTIPVTGGSRVYTDENLTTPVSYGLGTYKTLHTYPQDYQYQLYPDQAFFAAKIQRYNTSTQQWYDYQSQYTQFWQLDSSGYIERVYWNFGNGDIYYDSVNPSTAGLSGIKISSSGSSDAATACSTTPSTIVYYDETTLGNSTVLYTDSRDAGASTANNKFNGGGNWYKFENNYRAQISSTGVISNYASC